MSSRSVSIALNEAFGKHVDPWLDMLKTSYDGRGLGEDDIQALLFSNRAQGVPRNKSYFHLRTRLPHLLQHHARLRT